MLQPSAASIDCCAFCTASAYQIKLLYESLRLHYKAELFRDAVYIEVPFFEEQKVADVFFFDYGAVVCWGIGVNEGYGLLTEVKPYEIQPLAEAESDEFTFSYGPSVRIREGHVVLTSDDIFSKFAVSYGMAQSVKMSTFEAAILKSYNQTKQIPDDLARYGSISLSRKSIRRKMGELFLERSSINLHLDVLDSPEFFWEYPELEPLYKLIAAEEELETRLEVLNKRLSIVHELFEMLGNELNHQHSSRLEWTIIWLIIIEVVLILWKDIFPAL